MHSLNRHRHLFIDVATLGFMGLNQWSTIFLWGNLSQMAHKHVIGFCLWPFRWGSDSLYPLRWITWCGKGTLQVILTGALNDSLNLPILGICATFVETYHPGFPMHWENSALIYIPVCHVYHLGIDRLDNLVNILHRAFMKYKLN